MSFSEDLDELVSSDESGLLSIHSSWTRVPLGEIASITNGFPFESQFFSEDSGVPLIRIRDVVKGTTRTFYSGPIPEGFWVETGDILVGMDGDFACARWQGKKALLNQRVCKVNTNASFYSERFLFWVLGGYLKTINRHTSSVTVKHLSSRTLAEIPLPLPPLSLQKRIAALLDSLLGRLAICRASLDRASSLLKRFRQAVLEAGVSGELTAGWRGTAVPSWPLERADSVCDKVQSGGTPKGGFIQESGIPFLKVYNLVSQRIDFDSRPQFVDVAVHQGELRKSECLPGDVLMNIVGPPLGKVAIVPATSPRWNINQALVLFRPNKRLSSKWLYYLLCSGRHVDEIQHETKGSAGQVNISLSQCRAFEFPVPSTQEQDEIVRRVETLFTFADSLEARIEAARAQVERLTPALLAKAFRGELVPQDPAEGTGAELLARIRREKVPSMKVRRMPRRTAKRVDSDIERSAQSSTAPGFLVPPPPEAQAVKAPIRDADDAEARIRDTGPLLVEALRRLDGRAAPVDLWQASSFRSDIDGFYAQLRAEISAGFLVENVLDESRRMIEIVRKPPTSGARS